MHDFTDFWTYFSLKFFNFHLFPEGNWVHLGEIPSLGAIMSDTDMPVLNYDVIYDMCEPHVKCSGVSYLCKWSTEITDDARWPEVWTCPSGKFFEIKKKKFEKKGIQNFKNVIFKQLSFGKFWKNSNFWQFSRKKWQFSGYFLGKNVNFLAIFGQLNGNFPEGQVGTHRLPRWGINPCMRSPAVTVTRGVKGSDGSEINPHLGSREGSLKKNQNITLRIIAHFFGRRRSVQLSGDYCIGLLYIIEKFTTT